MVNRNTGQRVNRSDAEEIGSERGSKRGSSALKRRRSELAINSLLKLFLIFSLFFFIFLFLERESLSSLSTLRLSARPSAAVAADVRRAPVVSGDENGTDG